MNLFMRRYELNEFYDYNNDRSRFVAFDADRISRSGIAPADFDLYDFCEVSIPESCILQCFDGEYIVVKPNRDRLF